MQVYLNTLPVPGKPNANEIFLIESLTRKQILDKLRDSVVYPDRYFLAQAEPIQSSQEEEDASKLLTLTEYLDKNDIVVSEGSFHLLATRVAKEYIKEYGVKPRRVHRKSPNTGKANNKAYAYSKDQLWVIDRVLAAIPHVKNPRK